METRRTRRGFQATLGAAMAGTAALGAACGGSGPEAPGQAAPPATVRYLHVDTGQQVWQDNWARIFAKFQEKHPSLTLEVDMVPTIPGSAEKAITTFVGGGSYDFLYGHFTILPTYLQADAISPLDGFLSRDKEVSANDFHPAATYRQKGRLYSIAVRTFGKELWYNADLFAQAGLPTPRQLEKDGKWTWEALLQAAQKLTRMDGDTVTTYGFNYGFNDTGSVVHSLWAWGADWWDKAFTKPTLDAPPFLSATQFALDMVTRHRVAGGGDFAKGKLAMTVTSSNYTRTVDEQILPQNPFKVETTLLPKGPAGRTVAMANNDSYVAKSSKAPEAAWLFYKFLLGKDAQPEMLAMGSGRYVASKKVKPTSLRPYEDQAVYDASAAISRATPLIARQADLDTEWRTAWADMVAGKRGVRDALTQVQARAAQLILEGGCIC